MSHVNDGTTQFVEGAHQSQMARREAERARRPARRRHRALPGLIFAAGPRKVGLHSPVSIGSGDAGLPSSVSRRRSRLKLHHGCGHAFTTGFPAVTSGASFAWEEENTLASEASAPALLLQDGSPSASATLSPVRTQ